MSSFSTFSECYLFLQSYFRNNPSINVLQFLKFSKLDLNLCRGKGELKLVYIYNFMIPGVAWRLYSTIIISIKNGVGTFLQKHLLLEKIASFRPS